MSEAASNAFPWAYQWWLAQDFHFLRNLRGKPKLLDADMVSAIGRPYSVNRTLRSDDGDAQSLFVQLVQCSGQGDGMPLIERAARITYCVEALEHGLKSKPLSFISKASWFIWPDNWTMFDSYASRAVLGREVSGVQGFERFYAALDRRGWNEAVERIRAVILPPFDRRMAERVLDSYLVFEGSSLPEQRLRASRVESFCEALPVEIREEVYRQSDLVAEQLYSGELLWRDTATDREMITVGVAQLKEFKKQLAA